MCFCHITNVHEQGLTSGFHKVLYIKTEADNINFFTNISFLETVLKKIPKYFSNFTTNYVEKP